MTTKQLLFFIALAQTGSFTKAAEGLYITQPGLSYAIKQLEAELDVQLFIRNDKGVVLTKFGETFLPYAQTILNHMNAASEALTRLKVPSTGQVNITYIITFTVDIIPNIMHNFYANPRNRDVDLHLTAVQTTAEVLAQLNDGSADICISYNMPENADNIQICEQELVLVVPIGHRLANSDSVSLSDLAGETLVFCQRGSQLYQQTVKMFSYDNLVPNIKTYSHDCSAMLAYTAQGLGLAIVPKSIVSNKGDIHICHIKNPYRTRNIYISRQQNHKTSPEAQYFFDFCKELFSPSH